ncbi:unnamed protein product [Ilex paraguariensis]|uniref:F-box domain-containing protein n=1 Tax=Ilex paraguariensis TaxID=185542 RepID=A0ABC8SVY0_9AQUA
MAMANCTDIEDGRRNTQKEETQTRGWNKLNHDILVKIFRKLRDEHLLVDVSMVCCSWEIACWDVLFWEGDCHQLELGLGYKKRLGRPMDYSEMEIRGMRLVKNIMEGDKAYATPMNSWAHSLLCLLLDNDFPVSDRILLYIAERTPQMRTIIFSRSQRIARRGFSRAIIHWKHIQYAILGPIAGGCNQNILKEMGKNWNMLQHLCFHIDDFMVDEHIAIAIGKSFPRLQTLEFFHCCIGQVGIAIFVGNCGELRRVKIECCWLLEAETSSSKGGLRKKAEPRDFVEWPNDLVQVRVLIGDSYR